MKTKNSKRKVDLPDGLLETLKDLQRRMTEEALKKEGPSEVTKWVFANRKGGFLNMNNVKRRYYKSVLKKAKMHHTFASQLLSNGAITSCT